jgi:two-component system, sensor histidine kinase YesM
MYKSFKEIWYRLSIKSKIIWFFVVLMILPNIMSMYSQFSVYKAMDETNENLNGYYKLYELQTKINENKDYLQQYIQQGEEFALKETLAGQSEMDELLKKVHEEVDTREVYLLQKSIDFYYSSYIEESNKAISFRQDTRSEIDYYPSFVKTLTIRGYLESAIVDLIRVRLGQGNQQFLNSLEQVSLMKNFLIGGNILIIFLVLFFGYLFTNHLTKPIRQIALASDQMSQGDFNIEEISLKSKDEVGILARSFNEMNAHIKQYVKELNEKAYIEKMLHEQELKNIEMQQLLNDARYTSLQAQINPHYLFNTLNMIARTSMFENAGKTTKLIHSLAKIFRYHLEDPSRAVSLKKEIDIMKEYIFIQNERFGSRIKIELICEDGLNLEDIYIPCFTIQPLVENGILHGLESLEEGGKLRVKISSGDQKVHISIVDNGTGIEKHKLSNIFSENHAGGRGIGISNVFSRLKLFFDKDSMTIRSKSGLGTVIRISIPNIYPKKGNGENV